MHENILISPQHLHDMMDSLPVVIIDTRPPKVYERGHIPGAVNIHDIFTYLASSTPAGIQELRSKFAEAFGAAGLSGEEVAVIYEESMDTGFGQSCRGYFLLRYLGYDKAVVLHGGVEAWQMEGYGLTTQVPEVEPKPFPLNDRGRDLIIDYKEMLRSIEDPAIVKLDVRDVDEWIGYSSSPYGIDFCPRKGRIPNAVWLEWYRMMKPGDTPMFKTREEILAECETVGITPDTPVYLYCFKGARASNTFVALKEAGIKDVHMYFGSWNEWSRDPDLPIDPPAYDVYARAS